MLIDQSNGIIAGHGRVMAAIKLGLESVPVIRLSHLTETQRRAYILADNKLAELGGGWDEEMLKVELESIKESDLDHLLTGFSEEELTELLAEEKELNGDPDEVPETPDDPITKPGDLWILGDHRLLCGDSTKAEDVERLMSGEKAGMMVTDPPYGVEYDAEWRVEVGKTHPSMRRPKIDNGAIGNVANDDRADWSEAWRLFPGDVAYVYHADVHSPTVALSLEACNFERRALIIWAKQHMAIGRGDYHHQHEPCWYVVRKGCPGRRTDDRTQTTLWQIDKPHKSETGHSTQKPVECMARPMRNHVATLVYDPFLGSGTTPIAAEQLGRKCYGMEISPAYCDVIVKRWETLTGKKATRESDVL